MVSIRHEPTDCSATDAPWGNGRRETVIRCLIQTSLPVELDDLAAVMLAMEGRRCPDIDSDESAADRVRMRLHHVDLPYLDTLGMITYEPRQKTVSPADEPPHESSGG